MVEKHLRAAIIHGERAVDHHEVHVGVAPIHGEIADDQERGQRQQQRDRHAAAPAERRQAVESVAGGGVCRRFAVRSGPGPEAVYAGHGRPPPRVETKRRLGPSFETPGCGGSLRARVGFAAWLETLSMRTLP